MHPAGPREGVHWTFPSESGGPELAETGLLICKGVRTVSTVSNTVDVAPKPQTSAPSKPIVNDFSIQVATVNGSGSQSANLILMRSIFQMGIPVSGKNLFPSNIAGLPTWFTIRASKDGYVGRKAELDIVVAMNAETVRSDVEEMRPGTVLILNEDLKYTVTRTDLIVYSVPFRKIVTGFCDKAALQKLVTNTVYVGILAQLLSIDLDEIKKAVAKQFKGKAKAVDLNVAAIQAGIDWARQNLPKRDPYSLTRMNKTAGKIIIDGNSAAALGSVFGGLTVLTWYPITPSSSLGEATTAYLRRFRHDPKTGKATYAVIQAEDELASVGMVLGAAWAGARVMTTTSGPGISLMSEFVGLAYFSEVPCAIWDVQRVGPSTGLPTRTAQGDVLKAYHLSHGDTGHIVLFPGSVEECFEFGITALDLAEQFQCPVFALTDLDIGMNMWMADPFPYPEKPIQRGKVLTREDLTRLGKFERYRDVDGDGICYRTLPGTDHPLAAYFNRGSGHNEKAQYTERPIDYKNLMDRLQKKHETARKHVPRSVVEIVDGARVGIIAFGSTDCPMRECRDQLEREHNLKTSYLRLRALPFNEQIREFFDRHDRVYVVEQNRDGQLAQLLTVHLGEECRKLRRVLKYDGIPVDARFVTNGIMAQESRNA